MGPTDEVFADAPELTPEWAERRQARVDRALQAGWVIRHDPVRLEYTAARELVTARELDNLLDAIEGSS